MTKSYYTDKHGNPINYGDILKYEKRLTGDSEFDCKEPFFKLEKLNGKTMMYVSGMDEYHKIKDWQGSDDKRNTLKHFEIVEEAGK